MNIVLSLAIAGGTAYLIKKCLFGRKVDVQASSQKRVKESIPLERTIYLLNRRINPSMKTQFINLINRLRGRPVKGELSPAERKELIDNLDVMMAFLKKNQDNNSPAMRQLKVKLTYDLFIPQGHFQSDLARLNSKLLEIEKNILASQKKEDSEIKKNLRKLIEGSSLEDKLVWIEKFFEKNRDKNNKSKLVTLVVTTIMQWMIDSNLVTGR